MDGLELLDRAQRIRPETRGVLITAYGSPEVERKVRQLAGVYLPKPFHLGDIIQLIERLLKEPRLPSRAECAAASRAGNRRGDSRHRRTKDSASDRGGV